VWNTEESCCIESKGWKHRFAVSSILFWGVTNCWGLGRGSWSQVHSQILDLHDKALLFHCTRISSSEICVVVCVPSVVTIQELNFSDLSGPVGSLVCLLLSGIGYIPAPYTEEKSHKLTHLHKNCKHTLLTHNRADLFMRPFGHNHFFYSIEYGTENASGRFSCLESLPKLFDRIILMTFWPAYAFMPCFHRQVFAWQLCFFFNPFVIVAFLMFSLAHRVLGDFPLTLRCHWHRWMMTPRCFCQGSAIVSFGLF